MYFQRHKDLENVLIFIQICKVPSLLYITENVHARCVLLSLSLVVYNYIEWIKRLFEYIFSIMHPFWLYFTRTDYLYININLSSFAVTRIKAIIGYEGILW